MKTFFWSSLPKLSVKFICALQIFFLPPTLSPPARYSSAGPAEIYTNLQVTEQEFCFVTIVLKAKGNTDPPPPVPAPLGTITQSIQTVSVMTLKKSP